ncbi:MAG: biotin synthase BioB [Ruminococcus sp.]|nr:biotin synthase BioB [Ruminococcus sp.]
MLKTLTDEVLQGKEISKEEALKLVTAPLQDLCSYADEIRKHFCGNTFDMCTIINGKSGRCSENCKYCAQSAHYCTKIEEYPLLDSDTIVEQAHYNDDRGVLRYSIVTSGKALNDAEIENVCQSIRRIKEETNVKVCVSFGLLNTKQFEKIKQAGVERVHNNLETSRNNFPNVCTTHTFDDKIKAIKSAQSVGLNVCSGGIMGLGETMEDRIDLALSVRELGIKSIPINLLNPIPNTPYENNPILTNDEMCRIVAIFRFINPKSFIRLAGGRGLLEDFGKRCFQSGANAVISGDMLTTTNGMTIEKDMQMVKSLGYEVKLFEE